MTENINKIAQIGYLLKYAAVSRISDRFKKPLVCSFKITGNCNLNCMHCPFIGKDNIKKVDMSFDRALEILEVLYMDGVRIIIFEGGEPLLWKDRKTGQDIFDLIEAAKKKFFFVCMATNGTIGLDKVDPDIIFISLDGLRDTHDYIRGDSFDRIMSNIEKYHKKKKMIINTCISRINFMEIPELVKSINNKVFGITIQFFYPYPEVENLSLSMVQKKQVLEELIILKRKGYGILDSYSCLKRMEDNSWKCRDFLIASVESDGRITHGCYLKNRVKDISCRDCGFAVHCEISLAYDLHPGALMAAREIFWGVKV